MKTIKYFACIFFLISFHSILPQNWVPLEVGNKWQYLNVEVANFEWYNYSMEIYEVEADTIIAGSRYFKINEIDDWIRFSYQDQKLYVFLNDSDNVIMDFNLPPGSPFKNGHIIGGTHSIFDTVLNYKGYEYFGSYYGEDKKYTESIGETHYSWVMSSEQDWVITFNQGIIQAILHDSSGALLYYSNHQTPEIIFDTIFTTSETEVTFDFQVDHPYTVGPPPNPFSNGREFIDSVIILSYYSKNGNIVNNNPVIIPRYDYRKFRKTIQLADSLFTNGFNFYYKIKAKDKGIVPEYDFDPDSGYHELKYINPSVRFYPVTDTLFIKGTSTSPEILCYNLVSAPSRDSILIIPGANTYMEYEDSLGNLVTTDNCYFIVTDSLDQFEYELWYYPKTYPPFDSVLIAFDSTFFIEQHDFNIELVIKLNDIVVTSYIQSFKADWGLGFEGDDILPKDYKLHQNYPNPFNPTTTIQFTISKSEFVNLKVYDVLGNEIATLVNEEKPAGTYEVEFNSVGTSHDLSLPSGIYFYQLKAGKYIETKKMVLIK